MSWDIKLHPEVQSWLAGLDPKTYELVAAALDYLEATGPTAGRPMVDRVKGSTYKNMKELRPGSKGTTEVRILFVFDPERKAIVLVAGDKSGDWSGWYNTNISIADGRYKDHLAELKGEEGR